MATKLLCPQCRVELPATCVAGKAGVCPRCAQTFAAPRLRKSTSSETILKSRPYAPPPKPLNDSSSPGRHRASPQSRRFASRFVYVGGMFAGIVLVGIIALVSWRSSSSIASVPENPPVAIAESMKFKPQSSALVSSSAPTIHAVDDNSPPRPVSKVRIIPSHEVAAVLPGTTPAVTRALTSAVPQEKIDKAIQRGLDFLKANKHRWLRENSDHDVGYASLPALAMLEVGTAPEEPLIQEAARLVRRRGSSLRHTYDLSLAILFLDRLGETQDAPLIRCMALRLIAGQTSQWGWDYSCPRPAPELEQPFLTLLDKLRPQPGWAAPLSRDPGKGLVDLAQPLAKEDSNNKRLDRPLTSTPNTTSKPAPGLVMPFILGHDDTTRAFVKDFPEALKSIPIVQPQLVPQANINPKGKPRGRDASRDDNSNTQFALLALWTARRHGVPVERSLLMADQRFARSQIADGSWGYRRFDNNGRPAMTCVGLLGLALGHGSLLPDQNAPSSTRAGTDPAIQKGLEALGRFIGDPNKPNSAPAPNLYFLWSVERVAMLYQLPTIGGKDWYGWGAKHLVTQQRPDGSWPTTDYPGSDTPLDTAFALLFLRQSNLVPDLTDRIRLHMAITDPNRRAGP